MNAEHAWQATVGQLQHDMSKAAFDTWVSSAELIAYNGTKAAWKLALRARMPVIGLRTD